MTILQCLAFVIGGIMAFVGGLLALWLAVSSGKVKQPRPFDGEILDAYGQYDSDERVHGMFDYEAFRDAVLTLFSTEYKQ